jgi:hypothetical protein
VIAANADAGAGADAVGIIISTFSNTECDIYYNNKKKSLLTCTSLIY